LSIPFLKKSKLFLEMFQKPLHFSKKCGRMFLRLRGVYIMYKERISSVSERLKQAMRLRGKRQTDLCEACDIPKGAMSLYISGAYEPKQDRLEKLANALSVDVAWLMGYDVPTNKNAPGENNLTEGEIAWLELYRMMPDEQTRAILVNMVEQFTALSEDAQALVLRLLQCDTTK
jgi:transcriptional regulator with XRE-family HTH domain